MDQCNFSCSRNHGDRTNFEQFCELIIKQFDSGGERAQFQPAFVRRLSNSDFHRVLQRTRRLTCLCLSRVDTAASNHKFMQFHCTARTAKHGLNNYNDEAFLTTPLCRLKLLATPKPIALQTRGKSSNQCACFFKSSVAEGFSWVFGFRYRPAETAIVEEKQNRPVVPFQPPNRAAGGIWHRFIEGAFRE